MSLSDPTAASSVTLAPTLRGEPLPPDFEAFWTRYPGHGRSKGSLSEAHLFWQFLVPSPPLIQRMNEALDAQAATPSWLFEGGECIPPVSEWIKNRQWRTEAETALRDRMCLEARACAAPRSDDLLVADAKAAQTLLDDATPFGNFWNRYPKSGRSKGLRKWAARRWTELAPSPELVQRFHASIAIQAESPEWQYEGGIYVPGVSYWLDQRLWMTQYEINEYASNPPPSHTFVEPRPVPRTPSAPGSKSDPATCVGLSAEVVAEAALPQFAQLARKSLRRFGVSFSSLPAGEPVGVKPGSVTAGHSIPVALTRTVWMNIYIELGHVTRGGYCWSTEAQALAGAYPHSIACVQFEVPL